MMNKYEVTIVDLNSDDLRNDAIWDIQADNNNASRRKVKQEMKKEFPLLKEGKNYKIESIILVKNHPTAKDMT